MSIIHITDGQSDKLLDFITAKNIIDNNHRQSLKDNLETFDFITFADCSFSAFLGKHNRVIIPAEDQGYQEFIVQEAGKTHGESMEIEVFSSASYLLLKKAKIVNPQTFTEQTATTLVSHTTNGTEWRPGIIEGKGFRTMYIEQHTNPYAFLKRIATEFGLELRFRIEVKGGRVVGRFVDLLERVGQWRGREVEFGRDLIGIRRIEKTDNVYTALKGLGPEQEDGTRLEVIVEDKEALKRWGRPDPIKRELQHLWDVYEPQSSDQNMSLSRLRTLTENELEKRVNEVVEYDSTIADLEHVPGMKNKKIRFGDTIKIKDTKFNPPLYLEARVHTQDRSITDKSKKKVTLGDYIEYTEEQVQAIWKQLQAEIRAKLARMLITTVEASSGNVFKNGKGSTDLTATVFLSGEEVDLEGTFYNYVWNERDKNGIPVSGFSEVGKTITVTATDVDEKATYSVDVVKDTVLSIGRITVSNVNDGSEGVPGPPGKDGKTPYFHTAYADSEDGTINFSTTDPTDRDYIGTYTDYIALDSSDPSKYTWQKVKGENGYTPVKGVDYFDGEDGQNGKSSFLWVRYSQNANGNPMTADPTGAKYIGVVTTTTQSAPTSPTAYEWSLIKGKDGVNGETGNDGKTSYLHIKYSNDGGQTFTANSGETVGDWIGTYVDFTQTDSNSVSAYTWNKVKGEQGPNKVDQSTDFGSGYDPSTKETPTGAQDKANQAESNAIGHADAVSETAYIDAINDAEAYMEANGVMQGADYNGVSITNQDGFVTARGDGLVRTVMNSTLGYVIQRRANKTAPWIDVLYFDTHGNAIYSGDLQGATGTFGEVTVKDGDFTLEEGASNLKYSLKTAQNYIKDHSFELVKADLNSLNADSHRYNWLEIEPANKQTRSPWKPTGSPKVATVFAPDATEAMPMFGEQAMVVRNSNFVDQIVGGVSAGTTYTLSAYFRRHWNVAGGGVPALTVWHVDPSGASLYRIDRVEYAPVKNNYERVRCELTFTVPANFGDLDALRIVIWGANDNWVQCDGVQLVEGGIPTVYDHEDAIWDLANGKYEISSRGNILWAGSVYLTDLADIYPSKTLNDCLNGWVLEWSRTGSDVAWQHSFIPKQYTTNGSGSMHQLFTEYMNSTGVGIIGKVVYAYNDRLSGSGWNNKGGSGKVSLRAVYEY